MIDLTRRSFIRLLGLTTAALFTGNKLLTVPTSVATSVPTPSKLIPDIKRCTKDNHFMTPTQFSQMTLELLNDNLVLYRGNTYDSKYRRSIRRKNYVSR
jgi:hypothetical protein